MIQHPRADRRIFSQRGYVWDAATPAATIVKSQKTGTVTFVVMRSGSRDLGKWVTERRNVAEDYGKIFGEFAMIAVPLRFQSTRMTLIQRLNPLWGRSFSARDDKIFPVI